MPSFSFWKSWCISRLWQRLNLGHNILQYLLDRRRVVWCLLILTFILRGVDWVYCTRLDRVAIHWLSEDESRRYNCPVFRIRTATNMSDSHSRQNSAAFLNRVFLRLCRCCVFARAVSARRFFTQGDCLGFSLFEIHIGAFYVLPRKLWGSLRCNWIVNIVPQACSASGTHTAVGIIFYYC